MLLLFGALLTFVSSWVMAYIYVLPFSDDSEYETVHTQSGNWSAVSIRTTGSIRILGVCDRGEWAEKLRKTDKPSSKYPAWSSMHRADSEQYNLILDDAKGWPFLAMRSHILLRYQLDGTKGTSDNTVKKDIGDFVTLNGAIMFQHNVPSTLQDKWISQFVNDLVFPWTLKLYPYYIVPSGFVLNMLFYGCIAGIWQIIVMVLNKGICSKCNRCPKCWYNLRGLIDNNVCPECGWNQSDQIR